jgi:hypothetical protein
MVQEIALDIPTVKYLKFGKSMNSIGYLLRVDVHHVSPTCNRHPPTVHLHTPQWQLGLHHIDHGGIALLPVGPHEQCALAIHNHAGKAWDALCHVSG